MDCVNGINAYHTLDEVCGLLEKGEADEFLKMLEEMACYIFRADHLMLDCTADESSLEEICCGTGALAGTFPQGRTPEEDFKEYGEAFRVKPVKVKEGFTTAGQVQYVCRAGNYGSKGCEYTTIIYGRMSGSRAAPTAA